MILLWQIASSGKSFDIPPLILAKRTDWPRWRPHRVAFSEQYLAVGTLSGEIALLPIEDLATEKYAEALEVVDMFVMPEPGEILLQKLNIEDFAGDPLWLPAAGQDYIDELKVSPDGRWIAAGSKDGKLALWPLNEPTAAPIVTMAHPGGLLALAFSPDSTVLASAGLDGVIRLWPTSAEVPDYVCQQLDPTLGPAYWEQQSRPHSFYSGCTP